MSVDLASLKPEDLQEANLGDLLSAIENALSANEYLKVRDAIEYIYVMSTIPGGDLGVNKEGKVITTNKPLNTQIDATAIAKEIYSRIQADIDNKSGANADRDALVNKMNKYLTGLFNQQNLTDELINRGLSVDDFKKSVEKANERSKATIDKLNAEKRNRQAELEEIYGKDDLIVTGNFTQKSVVSKIETLEEAKKYIGYASDILQKINTARTPELEQRLKVVNEKLKECRIPGVDAGKLDHWGDASEITNTIAAGGLLDTYEKLIDSAIENTYSDLSANLQAITDVDKKKRLDLVEADGVTKTEYAKALDDLNDPDPKIVEAARTKIKEIVEQQQRSAGSDIDKKIAQEQRLIQLRNENVEAYEQRHKTIVEQEKKLKPKISPLYKQDGTPAIDGNGNQVYTVYRQKIVNGYPEYDVSGNPVFEEELDENGNPTGRYARIGFDLSDEDAKGYLTNFDENAQLAQINQATKEEKRNFLKKYKLAGWFKRTFMLNSTWEKSGAAQLILDTRKRKHIRKEATKDYYELVNLENEERQVISVFERIKRSAPIQQVLASLGRHIGREQESNANKARIQDVLGDMEGAAYEELQYQTGSNELKQAVQDAGITREDVVRSRNNHQPKKADDFTYTDIDNDLDR